MILIIDGYNLLHAAKIFDSITREKLINVLLKYKSIKKHTIVLVFDGGDSVYPQESYENGITIVFSGYDHTADDAIINLLKAQKNLPEKVVVSTDRALIEKAHNYNIISIDSEVFYSIVAERIAENKSNKQFKKIAGNLIKFATDSTEELDQLMQEGVVPKKDMESFYAKAPMDRDKKLAKTLSKEDKKIAEIIKKL